MMPPTRPNGGRTRLNVVLIALVALIAAVVVPLPSDSASAANAADFQDGYIISDENFFDYGSMDAAAVQAFLNARVTRCVGANGRPCLKDYSTSATAIAADSVCQGMPGGIMSAAQIIVAAARSCRISPKVLIVMLQKEQGLVTATSPTDWNYRAAMGQSCPDTAPCDSALSGFYRQVYYGARQFQIYMKYPGSFAYRIGWNNILYDVESTCGTKRVYIRNDATRALYIYTPYTPNAAALANLYGTGDGCSSYGNRNFWRFFTDWFGPPTKGPGELAIIEKYNSLGGSASWLGVAATAVVCGIRDGGCWQLFQGGVIMYSPATGANEMRSLVHESWVSEGYENGWMGYPTTPTVCGVRDGGCWQAFQSGVVMYSPATGAKSMRPFVHQAWVAEGYENGWMGYPTSPSVCGIKDGGCWQLFQGGLVMYSPTTGAQTMRPSIHTAWVSQGYENGWLGFPTSGSQPSANGGYTQNFQGGTIAVDSAGNPTYTGNAQNGGAAAIANRALTAPWLGVAGTSVVCGSINGGCWRAFQGGVVMYSPTTGAHAVRAQIHTAWVTQKYEEGWLGYPVGEPQQTSSGGYTQSFAGGELAVNTNGTPTFTGKGPTIPNATIANEVLTASWLGTAGTPVVCGVRDGGCWQAFQSGVVMYSPATGAKSMRPFVHQAWVAEGYENGWMGYPTSPSVCGIKDGGCWQLFQGGLVMYSPTTGAQTMRPSIHTAWVSQGYENGWLGFPTSGSQPSANGGYTQNFQGGTIAVDSAGNPTYTRR